MRARERPLLPTISMALSGLSSISLLAPLIALRMHVHPSEVVATTGMRAHMGETAKLTNVTGTQTFQRATMSSRMFTRYLLMAFWTPAMLREVGVGAAGVGGRGAGGERAWRSGGPGRGRWVRGGEAGGAPDAVLDALAGDVEGREVHEGVVDALVEEDLW